MNLKYLKYWEWRKQDIKNFLLYNMSDFLGKKVTEEYLKNLTYSYEDLIGWIHDYHSRSVPNITVESVEILVLHFLSDHGGGMEIFMNKTIAEHGYDETGIRSTLDFVAYVLGAGLEIPDNIIVSESTVKEMIAFFIKYITPKKKADPYSQYDHDDDWFTMH